MSAGTQESPGRPRDLEDLFGARILAWVGGIAVIVGFALLFALGVSEGWIGEGMRTVLAGFVSASLVGAGFRLHERRGRTHASLAAAATGLAGLFMTATVACNAYDLVPVPAGLALAVATGALATWLAIRWEAPGIAALGIVGGLCSPVLTGAPSELGTMIVLLATGASAVAILLIRRWDWLAVAVFACTTPQWIYWVGHDGAIGHTVFAVVAFGALCFAAALGFELRSPSKGIRPSTAFLVATNGVALGLAGWLSLDAIGEETAGRMLLAGLAVVHLAAGVAARRSAQVNDDLAIMLLIQGVLFGDIAYAITASATALAIGFTVAGIGFAAIAGRTSGDEKYLSGLGLGIHTGIALVVTLARDGQAETLISGGVPETGLLLSLACLAAGCFVSGRLAEEGRGEFRVILDVTGILLVAYLTALVGDGVLLTAAWTAEALALAAIATRGDDGIAQGGAIMNLGMAALYAFVFQAPIESLFNGLPDVAEGAAGMGIVTLGVAGFARTGLGGAKYRDGLWAATAGAALYLASVLVVSVPAQGEPSAVFEDLTVRQQGQMLLSALWALAGVCALTYGLTRDRRAVRLAALGLLGVTVAKVFLYDLAELTSIYRVVSFIGLGLLLLAGAFIYQRMRPEDQPDLREVPKALR